MANISKKLALEIALRRAMQRLNGNEVMRQQEQYNPVDRSRYEYRGEMPTTSSSLPIPVNPNVLSDLLNEYRDFYSPPKYYEGDDGYDAFAKYKNKQEGRMYPTEDMGPGFLISYDDGLKNFINFPENDIKALGIKPKPTRKIEFLEKWNMGPQKGGYWSEPLIRNILTESNKIDSSSLEALLRRQ